MSKETNRHSNEKEVGFVEEAGSISEKEYDRLQKSWDSSWLKTLEKNFLAKGGVKVTEPARQSYVVNKCVTIIGDNAPQAPLTFFKDGNILPETHPLVSLIRQPSEDTSEFEFVSAIAVFYALYGEAFIVLNEGRGDINLPGEMLIADPRYMEPLLDKKDKHLKGWTFKRELVFDKAEIIHVKNTNPYKYIRGLKRIDAVMTEVKSDVKAAEYQERFFENSAIPGIVLTVDKEDRSTPAELRKLIKMWEQRHQSAQKAYKTGILRGGMDAKVLGLSQTEMAFIDSRKFTRDAILSTFGVPPSMAGFTADINRAAAEVQRRIFWQDTIKPFLLRLQAKLQTKIVNIFDPSIQISFDFSKVQELQREFADDVDSTWKLFQMGFSRNELNTRFNFGFEEDMETGDTKYVPLNLVNATLGGEQFGNDNSDSDKSVQESIVGKDKGKDATQKTSEFDRRVRIRYERIQAAHEKVFHGKVRSFFFSQRKKILSILLGDKSDNAIEAAEMVASIDIFDSEKKRMGEIMVGPMSQTVEAGQTMALETLGIDRDVILNKELVYSHLERLKGVNDTIRKQLSVEIHQGLSNGETIDQIGERIKRKYNMANTRSRLIAQTETASAISHASMVEYKQCGVRYKRWFSAGDDRVREEHQANEAQGAIPIDASFSSGESYPGAPGCRCSISPVVIRS